MEENLKVCVDLLCSKCSHMPALGDASSSPICGACTIADFILLLWSPRSITPAVVGPQQIVSILKSAAS